MNSFILYIITTLITTTTITYSAMVETDPFDNNRELYIHTFWKDEIDISINLHPEYATEYWTLKSAHVAYWFDNIASIQNRSDIKGSGADMLEEVYNAQLSNNINYTITIVIYNLPNRDCAAAASHGEILCGNDTNCTEGLTRYREDYIDVIYNLLSLYPTLNFIAVIEPDSLPNLVTNVGIGVEKCDAAVIPYTEGIAYAIEKLSYLDNIALYIDAGHGGWVGWNGNPELFAGVMNDVFDIVTYNIRNSNQSFVRIDGKSVSANKTDGSKMIRGYVSNVSNYNALGCLSCNTTNPCNITRAWNDGFNEVMFAQLMIGKLIEYTNHTDVYGWIIDTSRNGNDDSRSDCSNWCNIEHAGIGIFPTVNDSEIEMYTEYSEKIDGLLWIKIPGESDGTSNASAFRYDFMCNSSDSMDDAPEAGDWSDQFFVNLVNNAVPAIITDEKCNCSATDTNDVDNDSSGSSNDANEDRENNSDDDTTQIILVIVCFVLFAALVIVSVFLYFAKKGNKKDVNNGSSNNKKDGKAEAGQNDVTTKLSPREDEQTAANIVYSNEV